MDLEEGVYEFVGEVSISGDTDYWGEYDEDCEFFDIKYEKLNTFLKIKFDKTFTTQMLGFEAVQGTGVYYTAIFDIYIGPWTGNKSFDGLTPVRQGYFLTKSPGRSSNVEIKLDAPFTFQAGVEYCLAFKTLNEDYYKVEETVS